MPQTLVTKPPPPPREPSTGLGVPRPALRLALPTRAGRVLQNSQSPGQRSLFSHRPSREG